VQSAEDVEKLLQPESGIVRHRGKIESGIHNARLVLKLQHEYGSFAAFLWSFLPGGRPVVNTWRCGASL
jgi:DNA-3-methyladenine glycosylase I